MSKVFGQIESYFKTVGSSSRHVSVAHQAAAEKLSSWLSDQRSKSKFTEVLVICTGNSRRSVFGAVLGNAALAYRGKDGIIFYSAGTTPTSCNFRTLRALSEVGFQISSDEKEINSFDEQDGNPEYKIGWGSGEMLEFSKRFHHDTLPKIGFAALLVCSDAEESCPVVPGAAIRVVSPFIDPKGGDNTPEESAYYSEIRDVIASFMLDLVGMIK